MKKYLLIGGTLVIIVAAIIFYNVSGKNLIDKTAPSMMLQEVTIKKGESLSFNELKQKCIQSVTDNQDSTSDIKVVFTTLNDIAISGNQSLNTEKEETQVYKVKATDTAGNVAEDTINVNIE